jgi:hypothetical protein
MRLSYGNRHITASCQKPISYENPPASSAFTAFFVFVQPQHNERNSTDVNRFPIIEKGKYGFIHTSGNIAITPQFNAVMDSPKASVQFGQTDDTDSSTMVYQPTLLTNEAYPPILLCTTHFFEH